MSTSPTHSPPPGQPQTSAKAIVASIGAFLMAAIPVFLWLAPEGCPIVVGGNGGTTWCNWPEALMWAVVVGLGGGGATGAATWATPNRPKPTP